MPRPYASAIIPAGVDEVWRVVSDFDGLPSWHPGIAASRLTAGAADTVGAVRDLTLADGARVVEKLVALDDGARSYTYDILESPFPVRSYRSTIRVVPITSTGQTFAEWWTDYDADGADQAALNQLFADGVFASGLAALATHFG